MEIETLTALKNGEIKAFETLFISYFGKVRCFIKGLLKSEVDAEDLAQDIFIKLWINRDTLDPEKSINAYLYTMARNAAYNFLKHKLVLDTYATDYVPSDNPDTPDELLYAKEIALLVEMTVCQMPEQRRRIYRLSRNEAISNEDIATRLNISKKTVENQLSLALFDLRKVIAGFLLFF